MELSKLSEQYNDYLSLVLSALQDSGGLLNNTEESVVPFGKHSHIAVGGGSTALQNQPSPCSSPPCDQ
jgi:hypothetical protein